MNGTHTQSTDSWTVYKTGAQTRINPNSGHDAARENWGSTWRMPTDVEIRELIKKCKWKWSIIDGHNGFTVIGPNNKSIFLPAGGCCGGVPYDTGETGSYWSSSLTDSSGSALTLYFTKYAPTKSEDHRFTGINIRPVTK